MKRKRTLLLGSALAGTLLSGFAVSTSGTVGCAFGGFQDYPNLVVVSFKGKILLGGTRFAESPERGKANNQSRETSLRIYDPLTVTIGNPITDVAGLKSGVRAGAVTPSRVVVGGEQGAVFTTNLRDWAPIRPLNGKRVTALAATGENVWAGSDGYIYKIVGQQIAEQFRVGNGFVTDMEAEPTELRFRLVDETSPAGGYCAPFLELSSRKSLDLKKGEITELSDNQAVRKFGGAMRFPEPGNGMPTSFPEMWSEASHAYPLPISDFEDALESYFEAEPVLISFPFWNNVGAWFQSERQYGRLKRMFAGTKIPENKRVILASAGRPGDSFSVDIYSLAIDRKDFMDEELASAVGRHEGTEFTRLLYRILREAAALVPPRSSNVPFPCASGEAASELLKRNASGAANAIAEVAYSSTTNPDVRKSLEQRLRFAPEARSPSVSATILLAGNSAARSNTLNLFAVCANQDPALHPGILAALDDPDAAVRSRAAQCAGRMFIKSDAPMVIPKLKALFKAKEAAVRASALAGLRGFYWEDFDDLAIEALLDPDATVRREGATYFNTRQDKKAVGPLIDALQDSDSEVRYWTAQALGLIGDSRALNPLRNLLSDPNQRVKSGAQNAIRLLERRK